MFVNESSQIINKYYYDFTIDSLTEFPSHFTEDFESIVQLPVFDGDTYGIHKIGSNYYFLAASGVTDSNKQNKTNSTMIFGRIIDQSMIESIESTSGCSVTLSAVELSTENILQTETAQFKP